MAKIVAKRKLRKSYYKNNKPENILSDVLESNDININGLYRRNGANHSSKVKRKKMDEVKTDSIYTKIKKKFVFNFAIQSITMIAILIFVYAIKYLNIEIVKKSEISQKIVAEFNKNYTIEEISVGVENFLDKTYLFLDPIIPDKLSEKSIAVFNSVFSGDKQEKNNSNTVNVYNEKNKISIYEESKVEESKTLDVGTLVEDTVVAVSSSTSIQDEYIQAIKNTGIEFVKPTTGVITSHFGVREKIFEHSEPFHYGTDIANNIGTPVYSSIDGTVTVCSYNSEVGNYIEVENGNITTRYFHLSKQLVKAGDKVIKGQEIGKMGDTGMVTGPHLHFEIMYNGNRVDATKILKLD